MVWLFFFLQEGTFGRHFVIFGIFLGAFGFFSDGGRSFLFGSAGGWGRCGAPERFVSPALPGEGAGGRGEGGARSDLLYLFLFSVSKLAAD